MQHLHVAQLALPRFVREDRLRAMPGLVAFFCGLLGIPKAAVCGWGCGPCGQPGQGSAEHSTLKHIAFND